MANMNYFEVKEKLALLNAGTSLTLYGVSSTTPTIAIDGTGDLVLSDGLVGDLFEWVDATTKDAIRVKGETDALVVKVVKKATITDAASLSKIDGPNEAILRIITAKANTYLVPPASRDGSRVYEEITGLGYVLAEKKPEYDALMVLASVLDKTHLLSGAGRDDVLELRTRVTADKHNVPFYIKKSDIRAVLTVINILKTFKVDFELPNELYQMKLDGTGYTMKTLPVAAGGSDTIPEPKSASEKYSDYEARLRTRFGAPLVGPGGVRERYANEMYDYSATVRASSNLIPNPDDSGLGVSELTPDGLGVSSSAYYDHFRANNRVMARGGMARPVFTDHGSAARPSEDDRTLGNRIGTALKSAGNYIKNHKKGAFIALLVAGGITLLAFNPATLSAIGIVFVNMLKALVLPVANLITCGWGGLTIAQKLIFIAEVIGIIFGVRAIRKHLCKKHGRSRTRRRRGHEGHEVDLTNEELEARISENEALIRDLDTSLVSLEHNYRIVATDAERESIRISIERAQAQKAKAELQIRRDRHTLEGREIGEEIGEGVRLV